MFIVSVERSTSATDLQPGITVVTCAYDASMQIYSSPDEPLDSFL